MVGKESQEAVARYYAASTGNSAALVAAFARAREEFIDEKIEWVEPFATLHGAETIQREIIGGHTQALEEMRFEVSQCFPAAGKAVCVTGRMVARFPAAPDPMVTRFAHVWEFRDSKAVRFVAYAEDGIFGQPPGAAG